MSPHGYVAYTRGCRCAACRQAKANYMRDRRATARQSPSPKVEGIKHGRYGYEETGCRCTICRTVKSLTRQQERVRQARRDREIAA